MAGILKKNIWPGRLGKCMATKMGLERKAAGFGGLISILLIYLQ
jgi:hypothetical protein